MRLLTRATYWAIALMLLFVLQCELGACYKTEVEITPAPPEEVTTKKSGFFSGVKNFFRSSPSSTPEPALVITTPKNAVPPASSTANLPQPSSAGNPGVGPGPSRPPPLNINMAPLQPLGPRPDTPSSSPLGGNQHQAPQWPQSASSPSIGQQIPATGGRPLAASGQPQQFPQTSPSHGRPGAGQPNLPPGFSPYQPPRNQPSGVDLSYGGVSGGRGDARPGGRPGFDLAPMTGNAVSTPATPPSPIRPGPAQPQQPLSFDMRGGMGGATQSSTPASPSASGKEDFPALPAPRRPSSPGVTEVKEDFPSLPVPKSPSPAPALPPRPSSPSAWSVPLPTPATSATPATTPAANKPTTQNTGVSFVPHVAGSTTTLRPGTQSSGNSVATDDEIRALTETLYTKEVNGQLNNIRVNPQGKTRSIDSTDEAPQSLLEVDAKALEAPTIAKMQPLFNNYEKDTSVNEHVTPNEHIEENNFLDAVMATSVMRQAMLFLQNKDLVGPDSKTHRDMVKELWFTQYSRGGGRIGSSGFEHVFVNEVKNGTIIGLHNWVYFNEEEKAGRLDYKGYLNQLDIGNKAKVMKVRFTHNGLNKPVNTLFIGTSPELELALYTVCFKLRPDRTCPVSLGNAKFGIVTYSWRYRGKSLIGSAYPEI